MATGTAVVAIAGTAMQMYGEAQSAKAQAAAARAAADAKREQGLDILKRSRYNIDVTQREGDTFMSEQIGSYISGGVEIEGSALLALEDTAHKLSENIVNQGREADAKAQALFIGADIDTQLSGDITQASKFKNLATATLTVAALGR